MLKKQVAAVTCNNKIEDGYRKMDFSLSEEQLAFIQTAREFAVGELAPNAATWDETHYFPKEVFQRGGELGFCGLYAPTRIGGLELSRLDAALILEEMAIFDPSTAAFFSIHNMATWMIGTWGTERICKQWGEALTKGTHLASYCLTEPGSGSDAASLKTRAVKSGDHYVISGSKAFISGAGSTDVLVVMARTGEDGPKGISAFVVPADLPGIVYGQPERKMGWNSQPTRQITFDDVRIPANHLLDTEGNGFKLAMKALDGGRINIATCSIGAAQGALNQTHDYVKQRQQFGKQLADFQALQFRLADMATELVVARQMVRLAAFQLDQKSPQASMYCAMAKRFATDVGFKVCNDALQLHGGYGYTKDYPVERLLRDSRVHQILEGTNEIMRVIIARQLLSLEMLESIR